VNPVLKSAEKKFAAGARIEALDVLAQALLTKGSKAHTTKLVQLLQRWIAVAERQPSPLRAVSLYEALAAVQPNATNLRAWAQALRRLERLVEAAAVYEELVGMAARSGASAAQQRKDQAALAAIQRRLSDPQSEPPAALRPAHPAHWRAARQLTRAAMRHGTTPRLSLVRHHRSPVVALDFSPDGKSLVTGDRQGYVVAWEVPTGKARWGLSTSAGIPVDAVRVSPDGRSVAMNAGKRTYFRDLKTGALRWESEGGTYGLIFFRGGLLLDDIGDMGAVSMTRWKRRQTTDAKLFHHTLDWCRPAGTQDCPSRGSLLAMAAANGKRHFLATLGLEGVRGSAKPTIVVSDLCHKRSFPARLGPIALDGEGDWMAQLSEDKQGARVSLWDLRKKRPKPRHHVWQTVKTGAKLPLSRLALALGRKGRVLATRTSDGRITVLDLPSGKRRYQWHRRGYPLTMSPDSKTLAAGNDDGTVSLWRLDTGREIKWPTSGPAARLLGFFDKGKGIHVGDAKGNVIAWDLTTGKTRYVLKGTGSRVLRLAMSHYYFWTGAEDGTLRTYDQTQKLMHTWTGRNGAVTYLKFCGGGLLSTAGWDRRVTVWGTFGKRSYFKTRLKSYDFGYSRYPSPQVCNSGREAKYVYTMAPKSVDVWSTEKKKILYSLGTSGPARDMDVSTSDGRLAIVDNDGVSIRHEQSWLRLRLSDATVVKWLGFQGQRLLVGTRTGGVFLWQPWAKTKRIRLGVIAGGAAVRRIQELSYQKLVAVFEDDGAHILDLRSRRWLARVVVGDRAGWVVTTPGGGIQLGPGAGPRMQWVAGGQHLSNPLTARWAESSVYKQLPVSGAAAGALATLVAQKGAARLARHRQRLKRIRAAKAPVVLPGYGSTNLELKHPESVISSKTTQQFQRAVHRCFAKTRGAPRKIQVGVSVKVGYFGRFCSLDYAPKKLRNRRLRRCILRAAKTTVFHRSMAEKKEVTFWITRPDPSRVRPRRKR